MAGLLISYYLNRNIENSKLRASSHKTALVQKCVLVRSTREGANANSADKYKYQNEQNKSVELFNALEMQQRKLGVQIKPACLQSWNFQPKESLQFNSTRSKKLVNFKQGNLIMKFDTKK